MFLYALMYAWCLFHSFSCIIFKFLEIFQKLPGSFEDALDDAWELDPFLGFCDEPPDDKVGSTRRCKH